MKKSSVKQFAYSRVPFHLEQAQMYKEMVDFLRSDRSRPVEGVERRAYLQVTFLSFINRQIIYPMYQRSNIFSLVLNTLKSNPTFVREKKYIVLFILATPLSITSS